MKMVKLENLMSDVIETIVNESRFSLEWSYGGINPENSFYNIWERKTEKEYHLTEEDILQGINMYIENGNKPNLMLGCGIVDSFLIDPNVADKILQYACFSKIKYAL